MSRRRFSLDFPGGSVLDLLNAILRAHGALAWHVSYELAHRPAEEFYLEFVTFDGEGMGASYNRAFLGSR